MARRRWFLLGSPNPTDSFQFPTPLSAPSRDRAIVKSADPVYPVQNAFCEELRPVTQKKRDPEKFSENCGTGVFALYSFAKSCKWKIRIMKRKFNIFAIDNLAGVKLSLKITTQQLHRFFFRRLWDKLNYIGTRKHGFWMMFKNIFFCTSPLRFQWIFFLKQIMAKSRVRTWVTLK